MTPIGDRVQQLRGKTLYTVSRHKPFDIVDILSDRIIFVPRDGKGTHRWASREQIEHMCSLLPSIQDITRKLVQEQYPDDYNTSYITAIVKSIL